MLPSWPSAFTVEVKFSDAPISMWALKHRRTWHMACGASLATSLIGTESTGMQELLKGAFVHTFFLTGEGGRNTAERETYLTWPNPLKHSNSHTWQSQLSTPGNSAPGWLSHWEPSTLESLLLTGVLSSWMYLTPCLLSRKLNFLDWFWIASPHLPLTLNYASLEKPNFIN